MTDAQTLAYLQASETLRAAGLPSLDDTTAAMRQAARALDECAVTIVHLETRILRGIAPETERGDVTRARSVATLLRTLLP